MNKGNFNAVFLLLSLFVYAHNKALAAELDEHNATLITPDEQSATIIKEVEQNATIIKEAEQNATIIKEAEQNATIIKDDEQNATIIKEAEQNATIIKEAEQNATIIKDDEQNATIIKDDEQNATIIKEVEQNATIIKEAEQNATIIKEAEQNATPAKSDEQKDTPAKSDKQNDTPAKSAKQKATPTKSAKQKATPTKSAKQKATPTKSAKQKATPTKSAEQNDTPIKSAEQNDTPIKSAEQNDTPIKSAEQNDTPIKSAEQYAASIKLARQYATPIKLPEQNATPTKSAKRKATSTKSAEQYVTLPEISLPEISLSEIALRITNLNNESSNESLLKKPGSGMRYELHKHLLCLDPEEAEKAIKHVSEAVALLLKLGSDTDSYKVEFRKDNRTFIYSKKLENIDIAKFNTKTQGSDKYDEIINVLWDSNGTNQFDDGVINGSVARVYNPNLLMMKKSSDPFSVVLPSKITYAFATKVEISDDTTVILCPSININYINEDIGDTDMLELLENVQPIETDINVKEALTKMAANISGFIIKKNKDSVDLTYINSIYNNDSSFLESFRNKRDRAKKYVYIMGSHTIMQ
ncbi:fam-a protein [Plasmodium vinckei lentum]|uniref:Fam-a protein n=1 Tax=Plasmodium vinckei lentum TaxID=138297 RepID=A0A6V7RYZ6_PLAVN|nr:fam-a protein [Plasmodium vinckei lentum]